eukprot:3052199-Amphidinium_carterae.1
MTTLSGMVQGFPLDAAGGTVLLVNVLSSMGLMLSKHCNKSIARDRTSDHSTGSRLRVVASDVSSAAHGYRSGCGKRTAVNNQRRLLANVFRVLIDNFDEGRDFRVEGISFAQSCTAPPTAGWEDRTLSACEPLLAYHAP